MSDESSNKNINVNYLSILNVLAAISVVFLHTNGVFWNFSKERYWVTANVIESVFYFAVPIFFMISGATLIDYSKRYDTKEFFKRRIQKTLIPYLSWTFIFLCFKLVTEQLSINDISCNFILSAIFGGRGIIDIYWYFPILFSIYLCIPLFSFVSEEKKMILIQYMIIVGSVTNIVIPFFFSVFQLQIDWKIRLLVVESYLLYVLLGYYFSHIELSKKYEIIIYALGITGLLMHIIGTNILSMNSGEIIHTYKGYNNLPAMLYSVAIFIFVKKYSELLSSDIIFSGIRFIKNYTFSIYLIHYPVMDIIRVHLYNEILGLPDKSIIYRLTAPFLIVFICIIIVFILRKIPLINKIVP